VEALVVIVKILEQPGLQGLFVKLAEAPTGRPEIASVTGCDVPEASVLLIVVVPAEPCVTITFPELESV
jgi:hypothetical protein